MAFKIDIPHVLPVLKLSTLCPVDVTGSLKTRPISITPDETVLSYEIDDTTGAVI